MTPNDGLIASPIRRPRNLAATVTGSIHDDATATALGFRGGTVAGSIHMDQFPPILLQAFGNRWFEAGSLSLYFRHATTDGEPVQAWLERPENGEVDGQVRAWATTTGEALVAEGTAACGNAGPPSALRSRDLRPVDPAELRILKSLRPGQALGNSQAAIDGDKQRSVISRGGMTEPLDWYTAVSPWGGPVAAPSAVVSLLYSHVLDSVREAMGPHVGLFGAIEIHFLAGPVLLDQTYRVTGEVVAVSQTPKTEALWFDSRALDENNAPVAEMRMMLRQMKQSSPRYQDQPVGTGER